MFRSWKLGTAFGIPLYVHSTFLLLPALVLFENLGAGSLTLAFMLLLVVAIFGCVLLHELGHALMARFYGIGTRDITLYPIGGVARLERMSEKPDQELAIAVAGPAVNLVLAALLTPVVVLAWAVGALHGAGISLSLDEGLGVLGLRFLVCLWLANISLLLFNLLPAFPMDGGRVLRALLSLGLGHLRATAVAVRVGLVVACLIGALGVWAGSPMLVVVALFVCFAGQMELRMLRHREAARRAAVLEPVLVALPADSPAPVVEDRPAAVPGEQPGFSGFIWDRQFHVWVRWHNGRPVAFRGGTE
jgi:Zn-dependent protease